MVAEGCGAQLLVADVTLDPAARTVPGRFVAKLPLLVRPVGQSCPCRAWYQHHALCIGCIGSEPHPFEKSHQCVDDLLMVR